MDPSQHGAVARFLAHSLASQQTPEPALARRHDALAILVDACQGLDPFTKPEALFHKAGLSLFEDPELACAAKALAGVGALHILPQCQALFLELAGARIQAWRLEQAALAAAPQLPERLVERRKRPRLSPAAPKARV